MAEGDVGFLRAIVRFFTFYKLRKSLGLVRAADRQFTGSVAGISDAFDITQDRMVRDFKSLRSAVAQVENVLETKKGQLHDLNGREKKLLQMREGALASAEHNKGKNEDEYTKAKAAFDRYQAEITDIEDRQHRIEIEIKDTEQAMKKHMLRLTQMQADIQRMPEEKAQQIADFVSNKAILALNDRLNSLQTSLDSGPIDAVRKANRELSATARISEKLSGTDSRLQDDEYARAGQESTSEGSFEKMLAARAADREGKTGGVKVAPAKEAVGDGRPQI